VLYVLLAATGMRISEALALETRHFINDGRTIKVEQQVEEDAPLVAKYLKSDAAYREIDLHSAIAEFLRLYATRFTNSKELASYVGMIPGEYSSGGRQRLGGLSKQGDPLLRFLWGEAGIHAVRRDPELERFYRRKLIQKGLGKARVAVARKLGIRMWIMLRDQIEYKEFCRRGQMQQKSGDACAGMPGPRYGAKVTG
jgi:transposase